MNPKILNHSKGVSLTEILLALSLAALAFFPVIRLFQSGLSLTQAQTFQAEQRWLASKYADIILSLGFDQIPVGTNPNIPPGPHGEAVNFPLTETIQSLPYEIELTINEITPQFVYRQRNLRGQTTDEKNFDSGPKIKNIIVSVSYTPPGREDSRQTYVIETIKADLI